MYGIETIKAMNRATGKTARKQGKQPLVVTKGMNPSKLRSIPNFGSYRPKGWRLVKQHFVDNSGLGQAGEMALTFSQFANKVIIGRGYGIIETGQFQVRIGEFIKKK